MGTIAFIGLGVMGTPMARNLLRGGHALRAFDVRDGAAAALVPNGAVAATSAAAAATGADTVITMLPRGEHVRAALFGDAAAGDHGAVDGLAAGGLVIDMSTILPADSEAIGADLATRGIAMVDAPVGRTSQHAADGKLLIMAGGATADVARARPLLALLGDTIVHCGPLGYGARMKVVNNYLSIALAALTAEALTLGERSGLDLALALDVMRTTAAGLGHLSTTYPAQVLSGRLEPGFPIEHATKDLGLAIEMGAALGTPLAMGAAAREIFTAAEAEGRARQDWTAVLETVRGQAARASRS